MAGASFGSRGGAGEDGERGAGPLTRAWRWLWRRSAIARARRWIANRAVWRAQTWERWAAADTPWGRFVDEVLVRPTVGRSAGFVVLALFAIVAYTTATCAGGGVFGAEKDQSCEIPTGVSSWAIGLVVFVVGLAALEHLLAEPIGVWVTTRRRIIAQWRWFARWPAQVALTVIPYAFFLLFSAVGVVVSFIDWFFVRVLGWIAGASIAGFAKRWRRYGVFFGWLALLVILSLAAPPLVGLIALSFAIALIFAVARRWSWIERDREAFMVTRRSRRSRPVAMGPDGAEISPRITRIGFGEDLRDEALFGIVALFALTPLFLAQFDLVSEQFGPPAFGVLSAEAAAACKDRAAQNGAPCGLGDLEAAGTSGFWPWLAFFGGELAKSVPLVDWSEVFQVENQSPIKPSAPLGAQIVFALRMTLDLLLIASILLALNIASRLRDRRTAFEGKDLNILDPFDEWRAFTRLEARLEDFNPNKFAFAGFKGPEDALDPIVGLTRNPALEAFDHYQPARLVEIALSADPTRSAPARATVDEACRRAALATLALAHDRLAFNAATALREAGPALSDAGCDRSPVEALVGEMGGLGAAARRLSLEAPAAIAAEPLMKMLESPEAETQRDAAWRLGLSGRAGDRGLQRALQALWERGEERARAQAAVSLSRLGAPLPRDDLLGGLESATHATARLTLRVADMLRAPQDWGDADLDAYLATEEPTEAALATELVAFAELGFRRIPAQEFLLGSPESEQRRSANEGPQVAVDLPAFDLAATAVTLRQFRAFAEADGRDMLSAGDDYRAPGFDQADDHPVTCVSWWDALAFCAWLSRVVGDEFRLPSEAEWEGACRGGLGSHQAHWWGVEADPAYARFGGRADESRVGTVAARHGTELPKPHPYGLQHMNGNVWEWCADPWHRSYQDRPSSAEPWLNGIGDFSFFVLRGGSWVSDPRSLRSAQRYRFDRSRRYDAIGFRSARTPRA